MSVIVTVYRRTDHLAEAIQSVLSQSYANFELIISDDAPSCAARRICAGFARDPRVRYRRNLRTLGAAMNVAAAMRECTGEYVLIMNDDDAAEVMMLEKLRHALAENPDAVLSFGDHWIMNARSEVLEDESRRNSRAFGRTRLPGGILPNPVALALRNSVPFVMGAMFRRREYSAAWMIPGVEGAYDQWMCVHLALRRRPFIFLKERLFKYRVHQRSESARKHPEKARAQVEMFSRLLREPLTNEERKLAKLNLARFLFVLGRDRLDFGRRTGARTAFAKAVRNGLWFKGAIGVVASCLPAALWRPLVSLWRFARGIPKPPPSALRF